MKDQCTHSPLAVVLAFLLGGLFGVGIAMLVAPAPGEQTRRRIRDVAGEIKEHTTEYVDETKGRVAEIIEKGKELAKETQMAFNETLASTREMAEKARGAA
jgi:gas vesicle protein